MDAHEQVLENALQKAKSALAKKSTGDTIDAVVKCKKALDDYQARLKVEANPSARRFANLREVHPYLIGEGYKISQSKLYEDRHKIEKEADGSYSVAAIEKYVRLVALPKIDGSDEEADSYSREAKLKADILEQRLREHKRDNEIAEGKWVLKAEVEQKHTAKLALLLTAVGNFINSGKLDEACEIVGGGKEKVTELKAFFSKEFRGMLGEYAKRPEFTVPKQAVAEAEEMIEEVEG